MTLLLIDGSGVFHAAYHASKANPSYRYNDPDDLPTAAISNFVSRIWDLISKELIQVRYTHSAVVFDVSGKNWRHAIYPAYKAHRPATPDDLAMQHQIVRTLVPHFGMRSVEARKYEADDLIATYVRLNSEAGEDTVLVTVDKDFQQLISPQVRLYNPKTSAWSGDLAKLKTSTKEVVSIAPHRFADLLAFVGDGSDNIKGVPGVGPKIAAKLLDELDLEGVLANAATAPVSALIRQNLITYADQARLARKLVALDDRVPVKIGLDDLEAYPVRGAALVASLKALEIVAFTEWIAWKFDVDVDRVAPCAQTLALAAEMLEWRKA